MGKVFFFFFELFFLYIYLYEKTPNSYLIFKTTKKKAMTGKEGLVLTSNTHGISWWENATLVSPLAPTKEQDLLVPVKYVLL